MKLNEKQQEIAIKLRELIPLVRNEETWEQCIDLTRATAKMLDALDVIASPEDMRETFNVAWKCYVQYWGFVHEKLLIDALGNNDLYDTIKDHPNGQKIVKRIINRIKEKNDNQLSLNAITDVDVSDILIEEMPDEMNST